MKFFESKECREKRKKINEHIRKMEALAQKIKEIANRKPEERTAKEKGEDGEGCVFDQSKVVWRE